MISLWKSPQRGVVMVPLSRFDEVEGQSEETFAQDLLIDGHVPSLETILPVRWRSYELFTKEPIHANDAEEAAAERAHVRDIADAIRAGEDVPPLVIDSRKKNWWDVIVDGRHRAWAARRLRLKAAPVVDLAEVPESPGTRRPG